jgi:hypothetical protein
MGFPYISQTSSDFVGTRYWRLPPLTVREIPIFTHADLLTHDNKWLFSISHKTTSYFYSNSMLEDLTSKVVMQFLFWGSDPYGNLQGRVNDREILFEIGMRLSPMSGSCPANSKFRYTDQRKRSVYSYL